MESGLAMVAAFCLAAFCLGAVLAYLGSWLQTGRENTRALAREQQLLDQLSTLEAQVMALHPLEIESAKLNTALAEKTNWLERLQQQTVQLETDAKQWMDKANTAQQEVSKLRESQSQLTARLSEAVVHIQQQDEKLEAKRLAHQALLAELTEVKTSLEEREKSFAAQQAQLLDNHETLGKTFEHLANEVLEKKGANFSKVQQDAIEGLLKPFKEQIEGFQKRVNEVHSESIRGGSQLEAEIKKVLEIGLKMSAEANSLTSALKGDKKTTGNWGEAQLERTLELAGLVKTEHYSAQEKYEADGQVFYPDYVINLPDDKHLVIDSKVSLVDYDRAISAESDAERHQAMNDHVKAVKNHIDGLSKKDYSSLIGIHSPSFVLMFMPIEPAYIEAMKHDKSLFNYGYAKHVILVSHTTLMPILRTVSNLWALEKNNESAREISQKAGEIYQGVLLVAERLQKVGKTLGTLTGQYNDTVTSLVGQKGLYAKVTHFQTLSTKASDALPKIEMQAKQIDHPKLAQVVE